MSTTREGFSAGISCNGRLLIWEPPSNGKLRVLISETREGFSAEMSCNGRLLIWEPPSSGKLRALISETREGFSTGIACNGRLLIWGPPWLTCVHRDVGLGVLTVRSTAIVGDLLGLDGWNTGSGCIEELCVLLLQARERVSKGVACIFKNMVSNMGSTLLLSARENMEPNVNGYIRWSGKMPHCEMI